VELAPRLDDPRHLQARLRPQLLEARRRHRNRGRVLAGGGLGTGPHHHDRHVVPRGAHREHDAEHDAERDAHHRHTVARGPVAVDGLSAADGGRKTPFANFRQYGLPAPELLRLDASRFFDSFRAGAVDGFFDAVVSDPPYGIRAGARCSGSARGDATKAVPDHNRAAHVPATQPYPVADVLADLLECAARVLRVGGKLSYLLPATLDFVAEDAPPHPALDVLAVEAQPISNKYARYLVVMRKARPWAAGDASPASRGLVRTDPAAPYVDLKNKLC